MTEPVSIDPQILTTLNDQMWRRVGITQTFDRLLVIAAVQHPGPVAGIRQAAGRSLQGGAAKFYEMSFPQLLRDLVKRAVLMEKSGTLVLAPAFIEKIRQVLAGQAAGQSHVEPTPGVTMEDLQVLADQRAEREKSTRSTRAPAAKKPPKEPGEKPARAPKKTGAEPRKRAAAAPGDTSAPSPTHSTPVTAAAPPPIVHRTPANVLFTSLRINKLLDVLDTGSMNHDQLGARLDMSRKDLERFLAVAEALGLTRPNDSLIELHWQGRELAKTSAADRRVKVTDCVKMLRDKAAELDA